RDLHRLRLVLRSHRPHLDVHATSRPGRHRAATLTPTVPKGSRHCSSRRCHTDRGHLPQGRDRVERSRILVSMRLTAFWKNMYEQFGEAYADSLAQDHVIEELGSRTVQQALADGIGAKEVWRAVCNAFDLPASVR